MKNGVLLALGLCLASAASWAGPGLRAGINYGFIEAEGLSTQTRPGPVLGLVYQVRPVEEVHLQLEMVFCRHRVRFQDSTQLYSVRMDYIRIPGAVKVYPKSVRIGPLAIFLQGGGDIAIKVDHRFEVDGQNQVIEDLYPFDIGVFLGGGLDVSEHLSLDFRLYRSAVSIVNKDEFGDIRNLGLCLSTTVCF